MTKFGTFIVAAVVASFASTAQAAPVDPTIGIFGDIGPVGTTPLGDYFNGDGIPTNATNYQTYTDTDGNELLLGLSITPRFSEPTPVNDGNGSFDVEPGVTADGRTRWNFSFYAELMPTRSSGLTIGDVGLELLYDLDSAAGTDISDLGTMNPALVFSTSSLIVQDSQNLTFGYLAADFPGFNTAGLNTFSPDFGEYSFGLRATSFTADSAVGVAVIADAGVAAVPLPAGLPLLLAGLGGLGLIRRRKNKSA